MSPPIRPNTTPTPVPPLSVRALEPGELERYHFVDATAFGVPIDPARLESQRPLIELDRFYVAEMEGDACGGAGSFPTRLTVPGGATVAVGAVSDVGVLPTHRRRGVLSALMRHQLADLRGRGEPLAVLHASEAAIYRRYGYGTATRWRFISVDGRRSAYRDDWPDPGGRVVVTPRAEAADACAGAHERARLARPGGLARNDAWWRVVLGDAESYMGGGPRRLVIVHHDGSGTADGYAIYEVVEDWSSGRAAHRLVVWELVGVTQQVELALWRVLFDHDLVAQVEGPIAADHLLWNVLADPRQARTDLDQDLLWVRLLHLAPALEARTYTGEGSIVFEVHDPVFDDVTGVYSLEVDDDGVRCTTTSAAPDLVLGVSELGACYLGGNSFRRLVRAGQVTERTSGAAAIADRLFTVDPLPWCWVRF